MLVLELWWRDNAAVFVAGSLLWTVLGVLAVLCAKSPVQRQRLAEASVAALGLWLLLAVVPAPRGPEAVSAAAPERAASAPAATPIAVEAAALTSPGEPAPGPATEAAGPAAAAVTAPAFGLVGQEVGQEVGGLIGWVIGWVGAALGIGALLIACYLAVAFVLLARLLRRALPAPPAVLAVARRLPMALGNARIVVSRDTARPFCCGLLRRRIVLPHALCARPRDAELRPVLLHELAHLSQGDPRGQVLFAFALPVLFWNPLFWWLRRQARLAAELVADDVAVRHLDRATYVRQLIDLAERSSAARERRVAALAVLGQPTEFFRRMKTLMQRTDRLSTRCSPVQTWLRRAAAVALVATGSSLWTAPALVAQARDQVQKQDPEPAAVASPKAGRAEPFPFPTYRCQITYACDTDADLGRLLTELVGFGCQIEGLEFSGREQEGPRSVTAKLAIQASVKAMRKTLVKLSTTSSKPIQLLSVQPPEKAKASTGPRIDLSFDNADIRELIDTIAKSAKANIVVAPEVQGTITLHLHDIPWRDALDSAVETLGYAVTERSSGILVITPPHAAPAK